MPALALLGGAYFYPLLQVLVTSVTEPHPGLGNYLHVAEDGGVRRILLTSIRISLVSTVFSVLLGYVVAYAMVTGSARRKAIMFIGVMVPFWISILVRAFAWVVLLRTEGIINNALIAAHLIDEPLDLVYNELGVVIGTVQCLVPFAVLTIYGQMEGIDRRLLTAAQGLGARPFYAFRRVFLPLSLPGVAAASVLNFINAIGYFIIPALLGGGKVLMVAEFISLLVIKTVNWGAGTSVATVLIVLVFGLLFVGSRLIDVRRTFGGA